MGSDGRDGGGAPAAEAGGRAGEGRDWASQWFDLHPRPHVMVTRRLELLGMNQAAQALLRADRGLVVRDGYFGARDRKANQRLAEVALAVTIDEPISEVFAGADGYYGLRAVALSDDADSPIALTFRNTADTLACANLGEAFGVTPAEQNIIEALLRGDASQDIALSQGKSVLTVRTHIKRAYAKLGVSNREQLFARLLPFIDI